MPQIECVETGTINFPYGEAPLPPIIILRNHDKQLIQLEGQNNDFANQLAHITSRISGLQDNKQQPQQQPQQQQQTLGSDYDNDIEPLGQGQPEFSDDFISDLTSNREFILNVVENIMKNTNLSDLVNEIEPIKAENRELRSLVLSQQEMMNGMNSLLFKLLNRVHSNNSYGDGDGESECDIIDNMDNMNRSGSSMEYGKIIISDSVVDSESAITLAISEVVDAIPQPEEVPLTITADTTDTTDTTNEDKKVDDVVVSDVVATIVDATTVAVE